MSSVQNPHDFLDETGDDHVVPFEVSTLDVRGRVVQLGASIDHILGRHDYPEPVARVLAEAVVLTSLIGTSLKFDGKLIVQSRTDGPVELVVADFATPEALRGYVRFNAAKLEAAIEEGRLSTGELLGDGVLALTIDQGPDMQRYQGIVQMNSISFEDAARIYFRQSEQIPTEVRLGVAKQIVAGEGAHENWRAGGILAQFLPKASDSMKVRDLHGGDGDISDEGDEDDNWNELVALMETIEPDELFDPTVGANRLLYRLFNERGVHVFESTPVEDKCSCSREKIAQLLNGFSAEEVTDSIEDGEISVSCEFCGRLYMFDPAEFETKQ